jgi:hypothetical protein
MENFMSPCGTNGTVAWENRRVLNLFTGPCAGRKGGLLSVWIEPSGVTCVPDGFHISCGFLRADRNILTHSHRFSATHRSLLKFLTVLTKPIGKRKTDKKKLYSGTVYGMGGERKLKARWRKITRYLVLGPTEVH